PGHRTPGNQLIQSPRNPGLDTDWATEKVVRHHTTPYGAARSADQLPGDHRFMGKTRDASTGYTLVGARWYDEGLGRFLSVDPVMDLVDPQQWHGYVYANSNPVTFSDPTGLLYTIPDAPGAQPRASHGDSGSGGGSGGTGGSGGSGAGTGEPADMVSDVCDAPPYVPPTQAEVLADVSAEFWDDYGHIYLDVAGFLPGAGIPADVANAAWYCSDGENIDCAMSMVGIVPVIGDGAQLIYKGGKWTWKGIDALATASKQADEAADEAMPPGCNSFVPGTLVRLADGTWKPIEEVEVGDEVLAADEETGEQAESREVTALIHGEGDKTLVTITVIDADGDTQQIVATDAHPFWAPELREWVDAIDLNTGDWLQTSTGTWAQVTTIDVEHEYAVVHNLTVAVNHTYYVAARKDAVAVLVHNDSCPLFRSDTRGPDEIFDTGFEPRGDNMDLLEHASGYSRDSGFVSTSTSESVARGRGGNVYEIRGVDGVDVNSEFPGNPFSHELEIAVPGRIDTSCIFSCTLRDGSVRLNPNYSGG
ncbi:polymorphic toxin-type HINT domain-containing protein, partial [Myceligenerans halotolerans]